MKKQFDSAALIAQFQARGGTVTVVAEGVRAIESDRTIYKAIREGVRAQADHIVAAAESESRFHRQRDYFDELRHNGVSTSRAHALSQDEGVL